MTGRQLVDELALVGTEVAGDYQRPLVRVKRSGFDGGSFS